MQIHMGMGSYHGSYFDIEYTVLDISLWTIRTAWSKTTLIADSVGGVGAVPPTCKMGTSFLTCANFQKK